MTQDQPKWNSGGKLLPCPECGGQVRNVTDKIHFMCIECEMNLPYDYRDWWCWKEIDRLKMIIAKQNKELRKNYE
jgi:hypothetical protein